MGLTSSSTGQGAPDKNMKIERLHDCDISVALAGNPNVGKSTVFNALTGMNQHTGNWSGKTVATAIGRHIRRSREYILADLPGTYSLMAHSPEEEVARDFICFSKPDVTIIVCDACCLERNLNLVLQTLEITPNAVVCVNLIDEAKKKNISINFELLSKILKVPVIPTSARSGRGLEALMQAVEQLADNPNKTAIKVRYGNDTENAVLHIMRRLPPDLPVNRRWAALRLLDGTADELTEYIPSIPISGDTVDSIRKKYIAPDVCVSDKIVSSLVITAEKIASRTIRTDEHADRCDRRLDKILTSKLFGIPIMIMLLFFILWLTVTGANYPSQALSAVLFGFEKYLLKFCVFIHLPPIVYEPIVYGIYRVLAWVVAVMLPPMAIFFPLFTLLEDSGYLPRVAFNLDKYFKKACTCGKQCLTMCMGFGCNAAGIVGCRIIDSPRERLIAILTNSFVPCNGRFPTMVSIIAMFLIGGVSGWHATALSSLMLTALIIFAILTTFFVSWLLSKTLLRGVPSSFTLELPPYRRPQIGKVIVRSIFDRTLFVLGRAAAVAAPAGLIIWLFANIHINGTTLLVCISDFLDPFAYYLGLDGVILLAFILGFPANEIVVPIIIMTYMSNGVLTEMNDLNVLHSLLADNGWTELTAVCMLLFSLMHWPCSTTCMTIKKETQSIKWTLLSIILPAVSGMLVCFITASIWRIFTGIL